MAESALTDEMRWASSALAAWANIARCQLLDPRSTQTAPAHKLGKLRTPESSHDAAIPRDPVGVDVHERVAGGLRLGSAKTSDENAIRVLEVGDGGSLGEELGVREDVEAVVGVRVSLEDRAHGRRRAGRDRGLFDDDLGGGGHGRDAARAGLNVAKRVFRKSVSVTARCCAQRGGLARGRQRSPRRLQTSWSGC